MELADIITLVKAGFTKDEIVQMAQPAPAQSDSSPVPEPVPAVVPAAEPKPTAAQVNEPAPGPGPAPVPQPQPAQQEAQQQPTMADLMQGIAKLTSAVQANAIAQSVIPQGLQNPPNAEDMLAEIIRPTFKERSL